MQVDRSRGTFALAPAAGAGLPGPGVYSLGDTGCRWPKRLPGGRGRRRVAPRAATRRLRPASSRPAAGSRRSLPSGMGSALGPASTP